jgi:large subunit ribosomal protein L6
MSRVGKQPVALPDKVQVKLEGNRIMVEGPLGRLERTLSEGIACRNDAANRRLVFSRASETKQLRMLHGLERNLVRNMVVGVTQGYRKEMEIVGIGYSAKLDGGALLLELGFANTVKFEIPKGIKVEIIQATNPGRLAISGSDKHDVGQFAARVRGAKPPEPYQGKGIKYANEVIRRKAGKAFVSTGV